MDILGILGGDPEVRNGFNDITVHFDIDADASPDDIEALVAQSQKRSAVFDVVTNPTNVTVEVTDGQLIATARRCAVPTSSSAPAMPAWRSAAVLTERAIDHVVLERGEVANSWRTERWDSLRLLTPNWMTRLPGLAYDGDDPTAT